MCDFSALVMTNRAVALLRVVYSVGIICRAHNWELEMGDFIINALVSAVIAAITVVIVSPFLILVSLGCHRTEGLSFFIRSFLASQIIFFVPVYYYVTENMFGGMRLIDEFGVFGLLFNWFFCIVAVRVAMRVWINRKKSKDYGPQPDDPESRAVDWAKWFKRLTGIG